MFLSLASNVFGLSTAVNLVLHNCGFAASRLWSTRFTDVDKPK